MAKKKKANLSPDTESVDNVPAQGVTSDTNPFSLAEREEEIDHNSTENRIVPFPAVITRIHPILFEVHKEGNAVSFLRSLITNLQKVDKTVKLLPKPGASADAAPLRNGSDIPKDESAKKFVYAYIEELHTTKKSMKGQCWIESQAKFESFKKNKKFFSWLAGSKTEPKITLTRTELQGAKRYTAGFFLNVVARFDLATNFTEEMGILLAGVTRVGDYVPEFQIEPFTLYRNGTKTKVYAMYASSDNDADSLNSKMAKTMATLRPDATCYTNIKVWNLLDSLKKKQYFEMQRNYADNHRAIRLNGILDGSLFLAKTKNRINGKCMSIIEWLQQLTTRDGYYLFVKVSQGRRGEIELWHHVSQTNAAKAWLSTALAEIARLSGYTLSDSRPAAEDMFKDPTKVWKMLSKLQSGVSLTEQRDKFMDFTPPQVVTSGGSVNTINRRKKNKFRGKTQQPLKLSFTTDEQDTVSVLSGDDYETKIKSIHESRHVASTGSVPSHSAASKVTASDRQDAKRAAAKAVAIANAAIVKHPPEVKQPYGDYFMIPDLYGNALPVVYISGKAYPLNEETLLLSRKKSPPTKMNLTAASKKLPSPSATRSAQHQAPTKLWWAESDSEDEVGSNIESIGNDTTALVENTSSGSDESEESRAASVGTASVVSWAQKVACQPYVVGSPAEECHTLQNTKVALRTTRGTVNKTHVATGKFGGLRKGTLKYSSNTQRQASTSGVEVFRDDRGIEDERKPAARTVAGELGHSCAMDRQDSDEDSDQGETFAQRMAHPDTQRLFGYDGQLTILSHGMHDRRRGGRGGDGNGILVPAHQTNNEIKALKASVAKMEQMMMMMVNQHQQQLARTVSPGYTLAPEIDIAMSDPEFEVVSPPRRTRKTSLERSLVVHHSPPPRATNDSKNTKKAKQSSSPTSNRYAALDHGEDDDNAGVKYEAQTHSSTDSSVIDAERKIKALSIQRTEPGILQEQEGTGRGNQ